MSLKVSQSCLALAALFASAQVAHAAVVAVYEFGTLTTDNATVVQGSTDTDPSTASMITSGPGFQAINGVNAGGSVFTSGGGNPARSLGVNSVDGAGAGIDGSSEATAVAANDYFTFNVTPSNVAGSTSLQYTTLTFDMSARVGPLTTYTPTVFLRSSVDNYAATIGTASQTDTTAVPNQGFFNKSFNLSTLVGTQSAPVTFRLYAYDDSGTSNTQDLRLDNVTVNANAVPEPASLGLLGLGAVGLLARRRRLS